MLTLKKFRVTSFRSVQDSGWIETDSVTALIGTNESGKTNLLVPLWKLNPAKGGEIDFIDDFPRSDYNRMRKEDGEQQVFIRAEFETDEVLRLTLEKLTGLSRSKFDRVIVARKFDGKCIVTFPNAVPDRALPKPAVLDALQSASAALADEKVKRDEAALKAAMTTAIADAIKQVEATESEVDTVVFADVKAALESVRLGDAPSATALTTRWSETGDSVAKLVESISRPAPDSRADAAVAVLNSLPAFVYYSNYGNLDSEIYLPHVLANMKRSNLGPKEEAKARTLKVLFEYVNLTPEEIVTLGKPAVDATDKEIALAAERTKERDILLRSADARLTKEFRDWWKQGDYRFRFAADGDHFRIWVSDDRRPDDIELESRSTGLQWFFSFFLVFLVERQDAHKGSILLLDEPGLSLHPLSQKDLSAFFESLSETNPILFTTHSPFMVDANRLDRVRLVYVDKGGATAVSSDLRAGPTSTPEGRSIYAVHAALGLSASDALLQGCTCVVVEGPSDQFYFTAMKSILIGRKAVAPAREIVFLPAGGAKGVNAVAPIVAGKDGNLPTVVLDDDGPGRQFAQSLRAGPLYKGELGERILNVKEFAGFERAEVEDLIPSEIVAAMTSRIVRGKESDFSDVVKEGSPVVPQIESYAIANGVELPQGWKVDLARHVKQRLLRDAQRLDESVIENWQRLFERFVSTEG